MAVDDDIDALEAELDGLDDEDGDDRRAKIMRFLPVILAVGALLIFSVVVIFAYSGDDDEVVVMNIQDIGPDKPAIKIAPESAGAPVPVEGQDNTAYNTMNQSTDDTQVAAITPPPEEPVKPGETGMIKVPPPDAPAEETGTGAQPIAPELPAKDAGTGADDNGKTVPKAENLIAPPENAQAQQPAEPAGQTPQAAEAPETTEAPEPEKQTAQAGTVVEAPEKAKILKPAPPATGGGTTAFRTMAGVYRVQIASTKSEGLAHREWKDQVDRYPDVLASLSLTVQRAVVKNRGTFYRVQGGPFPDRDSADSVCRKLKSRGQDCLVVRP